MNVAKARTIAGWVLTGLLGALFLFTAAMKFTKSKEVVEGFAKLGLADRIPLIASGEAISAILFLVPITHPLGVLLLSSYMGGAILAHMSHGESYVGPAVILGARSGSPGSCGGRACCWTRRRETALAPWSCAS